MDLYGKLQLSWSYGYRGTQLQFIDNNTVVYGCGNTLTFVNHTSGRHAHSMPSEGRGVGPIAVCPQAGLLAYAELTLQPRIFVFKYPACNLEETLSDGAQLEYTCLAFSSDGRRLASLSGVPEFTLIIWDWREGVQICSAVVGPGAFQLSFNPLNWRQLCMVGSERATLWTLEQCDSRSLLTPLEVDLPDKSTPVGTLVPPKQPPAIPQKASTTSDHHLAAASYKKLEGEETKSEHRPPTALPSPPDLSQVLYQESYEEFMCQKEPVVLRSHCWTPHQSIYLGCAGGQLLVADFEGGVVKVIANPQAIQAKDRSYHSLSSQSGSVKAEEGTEGGGGRGEGGVPQTGHAVLTEGSTDCLTLSRQGLYTAGETGVVYCFEQSSELQLRDTLDLHQPITSLAWTTQYDRLAVSTKEGAIHMVDPSNLSTMTTLSDHHHSALVGIDVLTPGSQHCVTCRSEGILQVWDVPSAAHVVSYNMNMECTALACPLSCHMAAVGTASGDLCVLSLTDPSSPKMVAEMHIHHSPVRAIRYDLHGRFMGSIASEGPAFIFSATPSSQFAVIGNIAIQGKVLDLSILSLGAEKDARTQVAVLSEEQVGSSRRTVVLFQIPNSAADDPVPELYEDATKRFSAEYVFKQEATITEPVARLVLSPGNSAFALLESSLQLAKFALPPADDKESVEWELSPDLCYPAHEQPGGCIQLSLHQKWLASVAGDGQLLLRLVENPEKTISCTPHLYSTGGCRDAVFTSDSHHILTTGDSGTLTCWSWEFSSHGAAKATIASDYAQRCMQSLEGLHRRENSILAAMPAVSYGATKKEKEKEAKEEEEEEEAVGEEEGEVKTWLELAEEEAHKAEDEQYAETKAQLRQEIGDLREKVLSLIATNEELPDIEKLERHEFILDMEEHHRLQSEEEQLIQHVREEIELSNLAKMFRREQIKRECWTEMAVKGKVVKAFQGHLEVSNYPLKTRSPAKLKELEAVQTLRRIELADRKVRNEAASGLKLTMQTFTAEDALDDDELGSTEQGGEKEEEGDPVALQGSRGTQLGGQSELLYDQFELHSAVCKEHQIVLLEDCIYRVKDSFNREFDEVFRLKQAELARIQEKNVRIRTIISQLKLDDAIVQPSLDSDEQPDKLLTVEDNEVTVERYISPEEQKKLDDAASQEEKKKLAEMGDNPRDRALDMMMGGRLEANVEEDLFKDFPRPDFMQKEPKDMTEEEIRTAREIERKEEAFLEEREKLKKALEAELRKQQGSISQSMEQFDERLGKLFQLKIKTEMAVHQEELKVLRLAKALLVEEEVTIREDQLNQLLDEKKTTKAQLGIVLTAAKKQVEDFREQYEQMLAEDREQDRSFKRDFADCEPYTDQLYKLFRKRPRGQRLKLGPSEGTLVPDPKSPNPFAQRPPSAAGGHVHALDDPMSELDHASHLPEGLEQNAWDRLVGVRRRKVESERKVKAMALKLAEMNAFLRKRQAEDERLQQEIQETFRELNKIQEDKALFELNLEIQFLLKQGQVEVDMGEFVPDFSDSVLVHRSSVEELNSQIKILGEGKLVSMTECKDFKKGIHMLEWEHKKIRMEMEDLIEKARDVQMLRVTKELQQRLMEENVAGKDQREIETLENTIELNQRMHHKNLNGRQRSLAKLQLQIEGKKEENQELDRELMELQVTVMERQGVEGLAGVPPSEANTEQRMQDVVARRRLVEMVKAQAQEISVLRTEVERLRMRTFPALVQVD